MTDYYGDVMEELVKHSLEELRAENQRLREALEFYADRDGDGYDAYSTNYGLSLEAGYILKDAGDTAREALEKEKKDDE